MVCKKRRLSHVGEMIYKKLDGMNSKEFCVKELAEELGISERTYYKQIKTFENLGIARRDSVRSKYSRVFILGEKDVL